METPYNGQEGGFQYIHGGPYDARDELETEFADIVSQAVIDQAVEEVESEGIYEWAPSHDNPDRADEGIEDDEPDLEEIDRRLKAGVQPIYGDELELRSRKRIHQDIDEIELDLLVMERPHGGIGHNHPPVDLQLDVEQLAEIRKVLGEIKEQLFKAAPDAGQVAKGTSRLKEVSQGIKHHANIAGEAFSKSVGDTLGRTTAASIICLLGSIIYSIIVWLNHVTLPSLLG
jgi:hypothetical protein